MKNGMKNARKICFGILSSQSAVRMGRWSWLAVLFMMLAACASAPERSAQATSAELAEDSMDWYHEGLHWTRTAAEYRAVLEQTYTLAAQRLETLAEGREPGTWAISADADETLVSNSQYDFEVKQRGQQFSRDSWYAWVERREAPALPGAVDFTRRVKELGGVVAIVTNRDTAICGATADNLRQVGIAFDIVLCREGDSEKEPRWEALAQGTAGQWPEAQLGADAAPGPVEILMWVGDNIGDFPHLDQSYRHSDGDLSEFGDRYFALPNPMYGSWEDNPKK